MDIAAHSRLVFIGDSVTDHGRKPEGEGLFDAIGMGYVRMVDALLQERHPERAIRVTNMGIGGHTVRDLERRWDADVIARKPDWLAVMIGINDVWRQFDIPRQPECAVDLRTYADTLEVLVQRTRPLLKGGLVLMTPFYIEPLRDDAMRRRMDEYGAAMKSVAARHGARLVDTQAIFDRLCAHMHSSAIAWDRVHPNHIGDMALARGFLDAVGFRWA